MGVAWSASPPRSSSSRPPPSLILGLILCFAACFAVGLGPAVWVVMAEIFPTRIRGRAMSIATISLWVACVALTLTFLSLVKAITSPAPSASTPSCASSSSLFVWRVTPETKGRSLEEIERSW